MEWNMRWWWIFNVIPYIYYYLLYFWNLILHNIKMNWLSANMMKMKWKFIVLHICFPLQLNHTRIGNENLKARMQFTSDIFLVVHFHTVIPFCRTYYRHRLENMHLKWIHSSPSPHQLWSESPTYVFIISKIANALSFYNIQTNTVRAKN